MTIKNESIVNIITRMVRVNAKEVSTLTNIDWSRKFRLFRRNIPQLLALQRDAIVAINCVDLESSVGFPGTIKFLIKPDINDQDTIILIIEYVLPGAILRVAVTENSVVLFTNNIQNKIHSVLTSGLGLIVRRLDRL